jgi:MFS transporter, OCT family, solute carrier family 22 (organic cation transporter), member 4/5
MHIKKNFSSVLICDLRSNLSVDFYTLLEANRAMNFDDILPYLSRGDFGSYQKKIYFLLCLPCILGAFHKLAGVFLLAVPDHRCRLDGELSNATFELPEDVWRSSIPFNHERNESEKCKFYSNSSEIFGCSDVVWSTEEFQSSAVKSFSLVCDRASLQASADSMMMFGMLIGAYIFGDLSDKYGRRPTFMLALLIQVVSGLLVAISPDFITYTIARMVKAFNQFDKNVKSID